MEERKLNSWEEFKTELSAVRREHEKLRESDGAALLFRGQANAQWLLRATVDRKKEGMRVEDYFQLIGRIKPEIESMTGVAWPTPDFPEIEKRLEGYDKFSRDLTFGRLPGYAYMAHLRHHGFPSPLLDWTRSPYIAAFFAFRETVAEEVSIYALSRPRCHLTGTQMMNVIYPGPYITTHRRHVPEWRFGSYDSVFDKGVHQQGMCWKLTIPAWERPRVLQQLEEYNLNAFSLFGSEESLMETLAVRHFSLASKATSRSQ